MHARTAPLVTSARRPIAQLLHDLRALGDLRRRADMVDARLDDFRAPLAELVRRLPFFPGDYARTLVHRDDAFELLVLTWSPGSAAPIHDHAGQDCWFVPLAGAFDLEDYAISDEEGVRVPMLDAAALAALRYHGAVRSPRRLQAKQCARGDAGDAAGGLAPSLRAAHPIAAAPSIARHGTWSVADASATTPSHVRPRSVTHGRFASAA